MFSQFISSAVLTVMKRLLTDGNGKGVAASARAIIRKVHWVDRSDDKAATEGKYFAPEMIASYFYYFK